MSEYGITLFFLNQIIGIADVELKEKALLS
jgi:hypothetical protein